MRVVNFKNDSGSPDSMEWLEWRSKGIGASDALHFAAWKGLITPPSFADINKYHFERSGLMNRPNFSNPRMERGKALEAATREAVEQKEGVILRPMFGEMDAFPYVRASFDGLSFDRDVLVEIKVSCICYEDARRGQVTEYYRPQIAHQLLVLLGNPMTWEDNVRVLFVTCPYDENGEPIKESDGSIRLGIVEKRPSYFRAMAWELLQAYMEYAGMDGDPTTAPVGGKRLIDLDAKIRPLVVKRKIIKERESILRSRLLSAVQEGEYVPEQFDLRTRTVKGGINTNWRAICESLIPERIRRIKSQMPRKFVFRGQISSRNLQEIELEALNEAVEEAYALPVQRLEDELLSVKVELERLDISMEPLKKKAIELLEELDEPISAPSFSVYDTIDGRIDYQALAMEEARSAVTPETWRSMLSSNSNIKPNSDTVYLAKKRTRKAAA